MSLISEALKKARQDAARQDAMRQRTPYAVGAADAPSRRTSFLPLLAGLGAGCLLAGALLVVAWSLGWGPFARPVQEETRVAEAAPPAASAIGPAQPAAPPPAPRAQPETAPPVPVPPAATPVPEERPRQVIETRPSEAARPAPAAPVPPSASPTPEEPPPSIQIPAAPVRPSPATPPQPAAELVDGHTYTGEVPVPGGGMVKLNGIAFSPERPVAVLDGRVMGPGESIQGFTLVGIEAGRVKLQGHGATVYVSPK